MLAKVKLFESFSLNYRLIHNGKQFVFKGITMIQEQKSGKTVLNDPRNIANGFTIPSEDYCDQPYAVKLADGTWLCVMTTGCGAEGAQGQHIVSTRSSDHGRTWSDLVDIEPADGKKNDNAQR